MQRNFIIKHKRIVFDRSSMLLVGLFKMELVILHLKVSLVEGTYL